METIEQDDWKLVRWLNSDQVYIYEFWHRPVKDLMPAGRWIKYTELENDIIVIEDGPYLGDDFGRRTK
jgi:hypothetical protein